MADDAERTIRPVPIDWRKPGDPLPWARFFWADWLSNTAIRRLSPDQRGRFADVWALTHGTKTPGVMTEEDVRLWCSYSPKEWEQNRDAFARVFNTTRQRGKWRLEDVVDSWKAAQETVRRLKIRARKGVQARARKTSSDNTLTTYGGQQVRLDVDTDVRSKKLEQKITDVPRLETGPEGGLSSAGADGTTAAAAALLERALRAGPASDTGNAQGGDA